MINILLSVLFLILTISSGYCQWVQVGNISTSQLNGVKFFNQYTGVAAGVGGIWRTTDGGYNWTAILNSLSIYAVSFSDPSNGNGVGDSGRIYRTSNNGLSWFQQNSPTTLTLYSVSLPTLTYGYIAGENGIIIKTLNSGNTWSIVSSFNEDLYDIKMVSATEGGTVGTSVSELFMSTSNGWTNSLPILYIHNGTFKLNSLSFINQYTVICAGNNGRIRRSTNVGINWSLPTSNTNFNLHSINFTDVNTGWICGDMGTILNSTNGGVNWTQQVTSTTFLLRSLSFINNLTGWAVGNNGTVLRTSTGGVSGIFPILNEIPKGFKLEQNYPNPFNTTSKFRFYIPKLCDVNIEVFDALGRKVSVLVNQGLKPSIYEVEFDGSSYSSGIYYYRLQTNDYSEVKKLVLLK